jgi:hypothetical protein
MFSSFIPKIEDLQERFNSLNDEEQSQVFREITANVVMYSKIFPTMPLLQYILNGENAVPIDQHGPIITKYKAWKEKGWY